MTSSQLGRGGGTKMAIWGDIQGLPGMKRGEKGGKKFENWDDTICGWSLR